MEANNAAAMREALKTMSNLFEQGVICTSYANSAEEMEQIEELYRKAKAALAKPPRNCDVYRTSWEVLKHWDGGLDSAQSIVNMLDWLLDKAKGEADEQK